MTPHEPRDQTAPLHRVTGWDRAAITVLGTAGCALSFDALQQMAAAIHIRGLLTYLFPLVIDGFIAYGVRALLVLRTAPFPARLYVWMLFSAATSASIWANALHAIRLNQHAPPTGLHLDHATVGVLSTLAPLALAGAVHLHILIARQTTHASRGIPTEVPDTPSTSTPPTYVQPQLLLHENDRPLRADSPPPAEETAPQTTRYGRPPGADMEDLLPIARKAVAQTGKATRATVRTAIRDAGLTVSENRLTELMQHLRTDRLATTGPSPD
ncbi:DUF2637 domain-containing protein [Streptomyces oceani]|uniref:DUF2637 domain-containing protein n=1 Tax=Streptomyces oceani TaxID=1075402 RepID=A0A1E7JX66_9ACTN|nr:DUF2637 domain-containing protein [Streptomyces oceani]OEU96267.1 hypothetical protein AN216_21490 [Streptomyces oceani]